MSKSARIYSTPTCPYCKSAKQYLESKGIAYEDRDVSTDRRSAEEMIEISGQMGVPVIVVGDQTIVGFDQDALDKALGI